MKEKRYLKKGIDRNSKIPKPLILSPSFGRRISRNVSALITFSRLFDRPLTSPKSLERATNFETSREILRPKEGLRMTGIKKHFPFLQYVIAVCILLLPSSAFSQNDKVQVI